MSKIKRIVKTGKKEKLYDIGVCKNHNFFANGVLVHNCHRFAKNVQDALLPMTEDGTVIFVGATTENPYFSINGPIISRSHIFEFKSLTKVHIVKAIKRGIQYYKDQGLDVKITSDAAKFVAIQSCGDARKALLVLELAAEIGDGNITEELCKEVIPNQSVLFDRTGEEHFDYASWMQGAIQASDPDAAVYALGMWLESGEDLRYIARRIMVSASEDAYSTPMAAAVAHNAWIAANSIGRPEADIVMAHAVLLIATAPRNKAAANAIWSVVGDIKKGVRIPVPDPLKDTHYPGAKKLGRGSYQDGHKQVDYIGIDRKYYRD